MLKRKIITFALIMMSLLCFSQESGWYEGKPIIRVDFKGVETVNTTELDELFKPYRKQLFSDELYREILGKVYDLNYFKEITLKVLPADEDSSSLFLEFQVVEKPAVEKIIFNGAYKIGKSSLQSAIKIKKGDIYDDSLLENDILSIKEYYIGKGYTKAEVTGKFSENENSNTVNVEFSIKEGNMSVISSIAFEGNTIFSEKALKKVLSSKEVGFLKKGAFTEVALQEDKLAIKMFYGEKGYIDAKVETIKREIDSMTDPEKEKISLTYVISEGELFKYAGTNFEGNNIFPTEELNSKIEIKIGDVFNLRKFELGYNAIMDLYFENGYTSNYIEKKETRNNETKEISFTIMIVEQERSHIENIIIKGNKRTKDEVILRELLFKEGDVFSKTKFINSFRNLFNLRYFSSVVPDVQPGSEKDLVDVVVNVEEQNTANVQFGISFAGISDPNSFPMAIFAKWEENNLLGTGRELSTSLNAGANEQSLVFGFTENWFGGIPLSLGFNLSVAHKKLFTKSDIKYPIGVPDTPLDMHQMKYHQLEFKLGVNSAYHWMPNFAIITLAGGVNLSVIKNFYNNKLYRAYDESIRNKEAKWGLENTLWTSLSLDDRDIRHDPSKGWFLNQTITFFGLMPKIEDNYFFRSETKGEAYFTLLDYPVSEVWNLKFVLGFYSSFSFQVPITKKPISPNNKFAINGMTTGRGWMDLGYDGIGNVMQNNWIEFRWPLAHNILSFDFFFDAVAVKKDLKDLKTLSINDYYFSFGPGLRFTIPQFPLRFLFANTFKSVNWKPVWGNGEKADWRFVISVNIANF